MRAFTIATAVMISGGLSLGTSSRPPATQANAPIAEVLIVGTYHMANPGRDIFNTKADDVLTPVRQGELAAVVATLKAFKPTKIAVERSASDSRIHEDYKAYAAGKRDLTRNEVEQIGFRLANELGHTTVHPVDADGEFPYPALVNYAKAHGRERELDALMARVGEDSKAQSAYLASHTILDTLRYMNDDAQVSRAVGAYFSQAQFGQPWDWPGADLVSAWFKRNMRIYTNIVRLVDSPAERVLVVYGAGHVGWLQYAVASSPNLRLRKLAEFSAPR